MEQSLSASALLAERRACFDAAARGREPDRVPLLANIHTWRIFDAGYKLSEALYDYEKMEDAVTRCQREYNFDAYTDFGLRNPLKISEAMGASLYKINDEEGSLNYLDASPMPEEDYPLFIEDYARYLFERLIPARFGIKDSADALVKMPKAVLEMIGFGKYSSGIQKRMAEEFGVLYRSLTRYDAPIEFLFNYVRGMKGISIDLRRNRSQLKDAIEAFGSAVLPNAIKQLDSTDSSRYFTDASTTILAHALMSPAQFAEFYWPYLKAYVEAAAERGKTVFIHVEESTLRILPVLMDLPKGVVTLHVEEDDIFEVKRLTGDRFAVSGGFPAAMLSRASEAECADYAKKLIDGLAPGGGYIFGIDKMLSFRNDARPENMRAMCGTVLEYGKR